ncbi:uncharacterized protein PgNI_07393 [Pyricularia grisea]|uniref:Uncharacterized protein n=1 Tax=Pyricularia grisea TaxID=148305 RepID=A0A6P8B1E9_PYRGI|nr:uncharacterized protein PgNI_07393 [Pyricularia grisea]TLD08661.1 hypothetical protein PgNI_07393 [Pyricularia grisea]
MHLKHLISFALALAAASNAVTPPPHEQASTTSPHDTHSTGAPDAAHVTELLDRRATADVRECRSSVDALRKGLPVPPPELVSLILEQVDSSSSSGGGGGGGNTAICTLTLPEEPWSQTFGSWWAERTSYRSMSLTRLAEIAEKCNGGGVVKNRTGTGTIKTTTTEPCAGTTTVLYRGGGDGAGATKTETYVLTAAASQETGQDAGQNAGQENAAPGRVQGPTADGVVISGLVLVFAFWLCM